MRSHFAPILLQILALLTLSTLPNGHPYTYHTYAQIHDRLRQLTQAHPQILRMYSAQTRFLLPHVGNCTQISAAAPTTVPCTVWIVELSNFDTLPSDPFRPELLISGELHGDEILGPHAILAYLEFVTASYNTSLHVRRMVDTRLTTLIPMTNAVGFERRERIERQPATDTTPEALLDPNRDFPFNQHKTHCMQTVAARVINELFRIHLFRVLITFHGGTNALAYEWGDNFHCEGRNCKTAPDDFIMSALAKRMSRNAGPAGAHQLAYPIGDMGKLVYPVDGGMEDWAYGASWSGEAVVCEPSNLGGYPPEKTRMDTSTKRCVTYLVEMGNEKQPDEHTLGGRDQVLVRGAPDDGHLPRNIRLIMSAVDAVEPYILLQNNITADSNSRPLLSWRVGGAFTVDGTVLQWSTIGGKHFGNTDVQNGTAGVFMAGEQGTLFSSALNTELPSLSFPLYCRIVAVVDRDYARQPEGCSPDVTPQSHLMGSRASSKWEFSAGEHKIKGSLVFTSHTVKIEQTNSGTFSAAPVEDAVWGEVGEGKLYSQSELDLFQLLAGPGNDARGGVTVLPSGGSSLSAGGTILVGAASVFVIVAFAIAIYIFARRRRQRRSRKSSDAFALVDEEELEERRALTPSGEFDEEQMVSISVPS